MFKQIHNQLLASARRVRWYSQSQVDTAAATTPQAARYPYHVSRNTRGSIPVYTDIRHSNKELTLIRNVEGNVQALANDLRQSLFHRDSPEAQRLKVSTVQSRHVALQGGKWKREVAQWLQSRGF